MDEKPSQAAPKVRDMAINSKHSLAYSAAKANIKRGITSEKKKNSYKVQIEEDVNCFLTYG